MKNLILLGLLLSTLNVIADSSLIDQVRDYISENGIDNGTKLDAKVLRNDAAKSFAKRAKSKECKEYGYCPEVTSIEDAGLSLIIVSVTDDGGFYYDVFGKTGMLITKCSAGESGDLTCNH